LLDSGTLLRDREASTFVGTLSSSKETTTWNRCYDLTNIFAEKLEEIVAIWSQNTASIYTKIDYFGENRQKIGIGTS
jgi:hypothetical protein